MFPFSFWYQRKYRIFTGPWFGKKKPDIRTFLTPFAKDLKEFRDIGKDLHHLIIRTSTLPPPPLRIT